MSEQATSSRETVSSQIIDRAIRDPHFRQSLLQNPKGTVEQELGVHIPEGVEIRVVEETPSTLYLVLPPRSIAVGQDLSDRELEQVAGGWTGFTAAECGCQPIQ